MRRHITDEKERNTIALLFLTKLGPWTLILEKLSARLITMLMFALLSLPIMAIGYSLGGISRSYILSAVWLMFVGALQMGTLAIMCSTWNRTTVGSFISTYVLGAIVCFTIPILDGFRIINVQNEFVFFPPGLFDVTGGQTFFGTFMASLPSVCSAIVFLILARCFIVRRAFLPPKNLLADILRRVDNTIALVLEKVSFGLIRLSKRSKLPGDRPVAWRETAKTSLGSLRYQFYLSSAISLLILCIFAVLANDRGAGRGGRPYEEELMATYFIFLTFVALHVVVKSASMFAGDRSRQTLDVLLTTPMSNREIVTQKFSSVFLTMAVYLPPFLVLVVCDSWIKEVKWASYFDRRSIEFNPYFSALASLITVAIYLPMLAWLSLLIGLRVRNQIRAIIASLVVIVAWGMIPIFTVVLCQKLFGSISRGPPLEAISSPVIFLVGNEIAMLDSFGSQRIPGPDGKYAPALSEWNLLALNSAIYGMALIFLRWLCLSKLDRHLKRGDH